MPRTGSTVSTATCTGSALHLAHVHARHPAMDAQWVTATDPCPLVFRMT